MSYVIRTQPTLRIVAYEEGKTKITETDLLLKSAADAASKLTINVLTTLINQRQKKKISRVSDKTSGAERLWELLRESPPESDGNGGAKAKKPPKAKKERAEKSPGTDRRARYQDDQVISVLSSENPRREGTHGHANFKLYKTGMTVGEYRAAGGASNHLMWDVDHEYISIK